MGVSGGTAFPQTCRNSRLERTQRSLGRNSWGEVLFVVGLEMEQLPKGKTQHLHDEKLKKTLDAEVAPTPTKGFFMPDSR